MTVDVEALLAESVKHEGQKCMTCRWLDSRPDAERRKWLEALEQPKTFPATQVARAISRVETDGGPAKPSAGSILNHRSGHVRQLDGGSRRQTI